MLARTPVLKLPNWEGARTYVSDLRTTTKLSATNYLLVDAGESTDQRRI